VRTSKVPLDEKPQEFHERIGARVAANDTIVCDLEQWTTISATLNHRISIWHNEGPLVQRRRVLA